MPILGYGMTLRRIPAYLAAGALLSIAVVWPREAMARIHNCEQASLLPDDVGRLYWVARRVLPAQHELMLAERCRWSDSAFAWVTTARVSGENGAAQWWMASCSRGARNWTCEPGVLHQEIETGIDVGGASRRVRISFDETPVLRSPSASRPKRWRSTRSGRNCAVLRGNTRSRVAVACFAGKSPVTDGHRGDPPHRRPRQGPGIRMVR